MSIKAVFRVQCDGPCKGWLSIPESYVPGDDVCHADLEAAPTAERAGNWPGERAARIAARDAGWDTPGFSGPVFCPACRINPLGIQLPRDRGQVAALIRAQLEVLSPSLLCPTHTAGACDGSTRDCVSSERTT